VWSPPGWRSGDAAVEPGEHAVEQRRAAGGALVADAGEAVALVAGGEAARQRLLPGGEHVDDERRPLGEHVVHPRLRSTHASTSGGSSDSEQKALTVIPWSRPAGRRR
jgi:hypothetical protein